MQMMITAMNMKTTITTTTMTLVGTMIGTRGCLGRLAEGLHSEMRSNMRAATAVAAQGSSSSGNS
jgi:hypothetical protein